MGRDWHQGNRSLRWIPTGDLWQNVSPIRLSCMKKALVLIVALPLLFVSTAAAQKQSTEIPPAKSEIPPRLMIPVSRADDRGEFAPLEESKTLNEPLALPRMRITPEPIGVREIRIYKGLVVGYPHSGLIVREERGKVSGRLFRYWPRNDTVFAKDIDFEAIYAADEAGRCTTPVRGKDAVVCTVVFVREPDWKLLLATLDSLHAWDLPDESRVARSADVVDGWVIRVEARRDTSYVRYQYHNPEVYQPPYGPSALRMMRMVDSLFRYTRPPANLRYMRGILVYGRDTSDFTPCGKSNETGFAEGMLYPIVKVIGDSIYRAHIGPTRAVEIEGWARRGDAPKVHYKRTFDRTWGFDSVAVARPASTHSCRT
jgi:hypothetical protein